MRQSDISVMTEDYLKKIYAASEWGGNGISVSGLAAHMNVVASTASENVRKLADEGLLVHLPYRGISLTDKGRARALQIIRKHRLIETYLYKRLGYEWDEVHDEAELLEHVATDRLIEHIDHNLGYPRRDPHGDPIPQPDGTVPFDTWIPLKDLPEGVTARVLRISDTDPKLLRYLESVSLVPEAEITMIAQQEYAGLYRVKLDGKEVDLGAPAVESVWVSDES